MFNLTKFIVIWAISLFVCICAGVICIISLAYNIPSSIAFFSIGFSFSFAVIILHVGVAVIIVVSIKKSRAPYAIEKLTEEISILKQELDDINSKKQININTNTSKDKEIDNINLLIKYKELLDKDIITKEEFEEKKKELLH